MPVQDYDHKSTYKAHLFVSANDYLSGLGLQTKPARIQQITQRTGMGIFEQDADKQNPSTRARSSRRRKANEPNVKQEACDDHPSQNRDYRTHDQVRTRYAPGNNRGILRL